MDYRAEVIRNCPGFDTDTMEKKLSLSGLGVAGESSEAASAAFDLVTAALKLSATGGNVADIIKKVLHHEVPIGNVREKLIKEMGDVHWYLEYFAATLGITTEQVLEANVAKLRARHPNGWTAASQQAKADETCGGCVKPKPLDPLAKCPSCNGEGGFHKVASCALFEVTKR